MNKKMLISCIIEICVFCVIAVACPPPPYCPPCHRYDSYEGGCVWNCGSASSCCNGSCCNGYCCSSCCSGTGQCCGGGCCASPKWCCDNKKCYDHDAEHCCYNGTGKTCPNNKNCCGDNCCDPQQCESCVEGSCQSSCDSEECEECDGNGNCKVCNGDLNKTCCNGQCCDSKKCESCIDGSCQICGGDSTKKCCPDGSCVKPCELEDASEVCEGATVSCPGGCNLMCEGHNKIVYTGNKPQTCKEPGCTGDCQDDEEVECSKEYGCIMILLDDLWCVPMLGGPRCIYIEGSGGESSTCPSCVPGVPEPNKVNRVPSKKCGS